MALFVSSLVMLVVSPAAAATKYFDVNGATTNSGVANNSSYAWTGSYWSTSSVGTNTTGAWAANDDAVFSAGTDPNVFFKVTGFATGTKFGSITVEEGFVQLEGGYTTNTGTTGTGGTTLLTVATGCRLTETNTQGIYMAGTVGITKRGGGLYNAGGNQKYVGPTYIEEGTVVIVSELSTKLPFGLGASRSADATIHLTGGTLAAGAPGMTTYPTPTTPGAVYLNTTYIVSLEGGALDMTPHTATFGAYLATNWICQALITGTNALTKTGTGTLTLDNYLNDYSGDTVVSAGRLKLASATSLPSGSGKGNVSLASGTTLDLAGSSPTLNGLSGIGTVDNVSVGGTPTLTVGANDQPSTFSGLIKNSSGTLALIKTGSGTLTLGGTNTYGGGTTLSAGGLDVQSTGKLGTGDVTLADGTTLTLRSSIAINSPASLLLNPGSPVVNLNYPGTNKLHALSFDGGGTLASLGVWGPVGSAAPNTDSHLNGTGFLNVVMDATTTLAPPPSPSVYSVSVTFTSTVTGAGATPTGTVTFKDGASVLGTGTLNASGVATFTTGALSVGARSITAVYGGDDLYNVSTSSAVIQTVTQATTLTVLSALPNPSGPGASVTFTATLSPVSPAIGTPVGNVIFRTNGVAIKTNALASGVATVSTAALPLGTNAVVAEYVGNANFLTSTGSVQQVVKILSTCSQTNALVSIAANPNGTFTFGFVGTPQAAYYLVAQTNAAVPMAQWSAVIGSTNTVTNGSGLWSITVTNTPPRMFYRSAAVSVCP